MSLKIGVVSDIHLEFGGFDQTLGTGDVLLIPGDLYVAAHHAVKRPELDEVQGHLTRFMSHAFERYDQVIHVSGNHEHYNGYLEHTPALIRRTIQDPRFTHLDKGVCLHKGVLFYGATFWTDYNKNDHRTMLRAQQHMNDFQRIYADSAHEDRNLHPHDCYCEHQNALQELDSAIQIAREEGHPLVVLSHHAPSKRSTHPRYVRDWELNGSYSSDLERYMQDDRIPLWVHGHTHDSYDYTVGSTRIVCNPRGYVGHHINPKFNPELIVEI